MKPRNLTWHELIPDSSHQHHISKSIYHGLTFHHPRMKLFSFCRNHFQGWYLPDSRCTSGSTPLRRPQHGPGAHVQPQEPGPKAKRSIDFSSSPSTRRELNMGTLRMLRTEQNIVVKSFILWCLYQSVWTSGFFEVVTGHSCFHAAQNRTTFEGSLNFSRSPVPFPWNSTFTKTSYCSVCFKRKEANLRVMHLMRNVNQDTLAQNICTLTCVKINNLRMVWQRDLWIYVCVKLDIYIYI